MTILNVRHTAVYRYRRAGSEIIGGSNDCLGMAVDVAVILDGGAAVRSL
jgi:hypothetical protein